MRAFEQLTAFNKKNSEAKGVYRYMQEQHLKGNYEAGIFCPRDALEEMTPSIENVFLDKKYIELKSQGHLAAVNNNYETMNNEYLEYKTCVHVFGTWRNTLGIYRIDPEIFEQSRLGHIPLDTPTSIFARLPDWCVYIEHPPVHLHTHEDGREAMLVGFWALFDTEKSEDGSGRKKFLNIVYDVTNREDTVFDSFFAIKVWIDDDLTVKQSMRVGIGKGKEDMAEDEEILKPSSKDVEKDGELSMLVILSLLLWLCAEEPDISNIQGEPTTPENMRLPKYTRHKKTGAFVPPSQPTVYDVGKRLGGEVRAFNKEYGDSDGRISSRKRPHIRRGHWHGVWRGIGQDKQFSVYWQPAIFVNTTF